MYGHDLGRCSITGQSWLRVVQMIIFIFLLHGVSAMSADPAARCFLSPELGGSGTRKFLEECESLGRFSIECPHLDYPLHFQSCLRHFQFRITKILGSIPESAIQTTTLRSRIVQQQTPTVGLQLSQKNTWMIMSIVVMTMSLVARRMVTSMTIYPHLQYHYSPMKTVLSTRMCST